MSAVTTLFVVVILGLGAYGWYVTKRWLDLLYDIYQKDVLNMQEMHKLIDQINKSYEHVATELEEIVTRINLVSDKVTTKTTWGTPQQPEIKFSTDVKDIVDNPDYVPLEDSPIYDDRELMRKAFESAREITNPSAKKVKTK